MSSNNAYALSPKEGRIGFDIPVFEYLLNDTEFVSPGERYTHTLKTTLTMESILHRPVGRIHYSTGKDDTGTIVVFKTDEDMKRFIRSYRRPL